MSYVIAAYTIVLAVIGGYIVSLARRQERLRREVASLREAQRKEGEEKE
jgi:CcmD family protein